jgi:Phosphoribosylformylglycinamidine (FGAM) synthase, synthetase domain
MEKKLIVSIQDMGAAGLTSSSFEMADSSGKGMIINLDAIPLRTSEITPVEMMLSESQERMLLACGRDKFNELKAVFDKWGLNCVEVGEVIKEKEIRFFYKSKLYKTLSVNTVVNGPEYKRPVKKPEYLNSVKPLNIDNYKIPENFNDTAFKIITHPNIASKKSVFTQYDYTIGTATIVPPGFSAAVLRVNVGGAGKKGFLLNASGNSKYTYLDPFTGGALAVTECSRNISACGGYPAAITDCLILQVPKIPKLCGSS